MNDKISMRIAIYGSPCSGKSTLANYLSACLNIPGYSLDDYFHLPNWNHISAQEFHQTVQHIILQDNWIIEGNYKKVRKSILQRTTYAIILDIPPYIIIYRALLRTFGRKFRFLRIKITRLPYRAEYSGTKENLFEALSEFIPKALKFRRKRFIDLYTDISAFLPKNHIIIIRSTKQLNIWKRKYHSCE